MDTLNYIRIPNLFQKMKSKTTESVCKVRRGDEFPMYKKMIKKQTLYIIKSR